MTLTCLAENTSASGLPTEHGLSLHIASDGINILFDMGQTELFAANAQRLGVDLAEVDIAILSHGHYDHGGGLKKFLELNSKATVYIPQNAFIPHYNGTRKYIGLDQSLKDCPRLVTVCDDITLADGISIITHRKVPTLHRPSGDGLTMMTANGLAPDDFDHEQYLVIVKDGKRVLFSGCSHRGILNIMEAMTPDVLVGGFHFSKFELDDSLAQKAKALGKYPCQYHTCHCTGTEQFEFMKQYIGGLSYLSCGDKIEI